MTRGYYGALPKTPDERDYVARPAGVYTGEFVDLTAGFPDPPYDQGQLGSCVSNGTAAAVDFARAKEGLPALRPPSRLFIYYNGRQNSGQPIDQDSGLQIRDGFTAIAKQGAPAEADWPYDIDRFADKPPAQAYTDGENDVATVYGAVKAGDIDNVIASGWPVVFGFTVHESFESDQVAETGIMPIPAHGEQELGGHCVVAVSTVKSGAQIPGADPKLWYRKCRNSWGHDGTWGLPDAPGYFWMPASVMEAKGDDCWQVTTMTSPDAPTPPAPAPAPAPGPSSVDQVVAFMRASWAAFDAWLKARGL